MSGIRSVSSLEFAARDAAERAAGCRLRHNAKGRGPDWLNKRRKAAVFIHGCFWHGCPVHGTTPKTNTEFWSRKLERNRQRDASTLAEYAGLGWRTFVLWEHDLRQSACGYPRPSGPPCGASIRESAG